MRNTLNSPISKKEVLDVLSDLEYSEDDEPLCGDTTYMIISKLKEVVEKSWGSEVWMQGLYEEHFGKE